MAISATKEIYINTLSSKTLVAPTGHSVNTAEGSPKVADPASFDNLPFTVLVAADDVDNSTPATAFDALITAAQTALETYITSQFNATANTIEYSARVDEVVSENIDDYYTPVADWNWKVSGVFRVELITI